MLGDKMEYPPYPIPFYEPNIFFLGGEGGGTKDISTKKRCNIYTTSILK